MLMIIWSSVSKWWKPANVLADLLCVGTVPAVVAYVQCGDCCGSSFGCGWFQKPLVMWLRLKSLVVWLKPKTLSVRKDRGCCNPYADDERQQTAVMVGGYFSSPNCGILSLWQGKTVTNPTQLRDTHPSVPSRKLKNLYEGHLIHCFLTGVVSLDGFKVSLPKLRSWTQCELYH